MKSLIPIALAASATLTTGIIAAIAVTGSPGKGTAGTVPPPPATVAHLEAQPPAAATATDSATGVPAPAAAACALETRYLLNDDGSTTRVFTCPGDGSPSRHAYASYPTPALESLAYADAKAAEVLGMRLRHIDEAQALSLTLRAAALAGGDPAPILAFSNAYPEPTAIDGVPLRRTVHTKFILSAVADMLGAERNNLPYWKGEIRRLSSDPEREIELLMKQARRIVEEMREIEVELTGSSTFGGQSDA